MKELTAHRRTVLSVVQSSHDHPTARVVFERATHQSRSLSFATVYNALKFLTQRGYIRQLNFGEDSARYDGTLDQHHHVFCRKCGHVEDIIQTTASRTATDFALSQDFVLEEVSITLIGLCGACADSA